jgi:hypothetical protein
LLSNRGRPWTPIAVELGIQPTMLRTPETEGRLRWRLFGSRISIRAASLLPL